MQLSTLFHSHQGDRDDLFMYILGKRLFNPLPDDKILNRSKLKQSADDNFDFDENSRKFSKRLENTVGKGEIARYEQFLLVPQCFQKACFPEASKGVIVWEWVKLSVATDISYSGSLIHTKDHQCCRLESFSFSSWKLIFFCKCCPDISRFK